MAELALLCLLLPLLAGPAAEGVLAGGVDFSGITLAVTAPEGDDVPRQLEQYMGNMSDIRAYCSFRAMERAEAIEALEAGTVTAVLALPADFVGGILDGTNPDVELIVSANRPLESLLTLWVGQSACDILAAFQAGIYGVLELYAASPPAGLTWEEAMVEINLRYISRTLNRQEMFKTQTLSAVGVLPVQLHYALSLLAYLGLALAPLLAGVYGREWLAFQRRLRCAGRGSLVCWGCSLGACTILLLPLMALALALLTGGELLPVLGTALLWALFCAAFGSLCCLAAGSGALCGAASFLLSLLALGLGGGILPPVLLPHSLRALSWLSPVVWLRALATPLSGYDGPEPRSLAAMGAALIAMLAASALLYHRRVERGEGEG